MAPTTYTAFSNAIANVPVTGVTTALQAFPDQINTALLPLSYPRLPEGDEAPLTTEGEGGWPTLTVERVFLIQPVMQSIDELNHAATLALIDNINAAFRGVSIGQIGKSKIKWSTRARIVPSGNVEYWGIVVRVTGNG